MMSAERTNNSGAELAGCPSCAQPTRLISKDNALARARSVHLRTAKDEGCYTPRSVRAAAIPVATALWNRNIYRERNDRGSQQSARVKYDEHQELDMAADRYRLDAPRTVLMNCHVHEWQRTTALSAPSHPAAYK
jgi:hypothetical protein